MSRPLHRWSVIAAAALSVVPAARGQPAGGKGLDGLDEGTVRASMAEFGLTDLFNRDCDLFKIPADQRGAALALTQLAKLANPGNLKVAQRRALAVSAAQGLEKLLPAEVNPQQITDQAGKLLAGGVRPTEDEVDYFGATPVALDSLHTVAEVDRAMFQRAAELIEKDAAGLQAKLAKATGAQQAQIIAQFQPIKQARLAARYNASMVTYDACLGLPKGDPQRAALAKPAIEYLRQFDNPDSTVQPLVKNRVGKLLMAAGDIAGAKKEFAAVAAGKDVRPDPTLPHQHEARYFAAAADLQAGDLAAAAQGVADLGQWEQGSFLPTLAPADQNSIKAAYTMLQFRLASAQADAATDPGERKKLNDGAIALVEKLLDDQPDMSDLVFDQMASRVPEDANLAGLNPLILRGMQQPGLDEFNKWANGDQKAPPDEKVMDKALAAAGELAKRKGQPGVSDAMAARSAYFLGYGLMSLGRDKPAAKAFMDYAEQNEADPGSSKDALDHAEALVGKLREAQKKSGTADEETRQLYDRFLPLAINAPFNEKRFAFDYGLTLREERRYAEAAKAFAEIPPTEKRYDAAQFLLAVSLSDELTDAGQALPPDQRKPVAEQLQSIATAVTTKAQAAANAATGDDKQRPLAQLAAVLYKASASARRDLQDPTKALTWLDGFERKIAGLKDEKSFDQVVITLRVSCDMDLGKTQEAAQTLSPLLATDPAAAEGLLFDLIQQVGRDLATAKAANNLAGERQLAASQAQLSGFLVSFAERSNNPKIKDKLDNYRLFDATSKRQAAELAADPATKTANLKAALAQYQTLTKLPASKEAADLIDAAKQGVGLTQFDLGNYKEAQTNLSDLLRRKRVGEPFMLDANQNNVENPQFWETAYKLIKSIDELAKASPNDVAAKTDRANAATYLKQLYVTYGDKTGGTGYKAEFTALRADLAPDLKLAPLPVSVPGK